MNNNKIHEGKRWGGMDWATEQREIMLIGNGGIGSFTALSLARIGHSLILIDPDICDLTNVQGGQLHRTTDIGRDKVAAVSEICREFGCTSEITTINEFF